MSDFIYKHDNLFIICFGTIFFPRNSTIQRLIDFAKENTKYAFIMGLKTSFFDSEILRQAENVENILI